MAKKKLSYTEAINEIEEILVKIEDENINVDELSDYLKRVAELVKYCKSKLFSIEADVEKILNEIN